MPKILLVDSNETFRLGVKAILTDQIIRAQIDVVDDKVDLIVLLRNYNYDLIIIELLTDGGFGERMIKKIKRCAPQSFLLVLTELDELKHAARLIRSGVNGYLMKSSSPSDLLDGVRRVLEGKLLISHSLAEVLVVDSIQPPARSAYELLSEREQQIFAMLVCGWKLAQVADVLSLSAKTISTHKQRMMRKLQCENISSLINYALSHELLAECKLRCESM